MLYLLRSSSSPLFPRPVCLTPSIAPSVPVSRDVRVSGTNVTLVWLPKLLVRVMPCFARLQTDQPSFWRRVMSCLPVKAGVLVYIGGTLSGSQLTKRLNIWSKESVLVDRSRDSDFAFRLGMVRTNILLFEESFSFAYIFQGVYMKYYCFPKSTFCFRKGTTKSRSTKFFTVSSPSSALLTKLQSKNYIPNNSHHCLLWFQSGKYYLLVYSVHLVHSVHHYNNFTTCCQALLVGYQPQVRRTSKYCQRGWR